MRSFLLIASIALAQAPWVASQDIWDIVSSYIAVMTGAIIDSCLAVGNSGRRLGIEANCSQMSAHRQPSLSVPRVRLAMQTSWLMIPQRTNRYGVSEGL